MRNYLIIFLTLVGCGTDKDSDADSATKPAPYSMALASAADLPPCDADHDKQLVYLLAEREFHTCQAGAWTKVDLSAAGTTTSAEDLAAEANKVRNILGTIRLIDDKLDTILPEARELILSGKKTTQGDLDTYEIGKFVGGEKVYFFIVSVGQPSGAIITISEP